MDCSLCTKHGFNTLFYPISLFNLHSDFQSRYAHISVSETGKLRQGEANNLPQFKEPVHVRGRLYPGHALQYMSYCCDHLFTRTHCKLAQDVNPPSTSAPDTVTRVSAWSVHSADGR